MIKSLLATLAAFASAIPALAPAQVYITPPVFAGGPVTGNEDGLGLPLPGATSEEYSAALVWGLRSGLNVAALQCAQSAFLDTTDNYNAMLFNNRAELAAAYKAITAYFARTAEGTGSIKTRAAMQALNRYDTRSYNGWSTLYAQRGFCHQASLIGKQLRFIPKGGLLPFAQANMLSLRSSLTYAGDPLWATRPLYLPYVEIRYPDACYDKRGEVKRKCLR